MSRPVTPAWLLLIAYQYLHANLAVEPNQGFLLIICLRRVNVSDCLIPRLQIIGNDSVQGLAGSETNPRSLTL